MYDILSKHQITAMDQSISPKYTADSFIPISSESNNQINVRPHNERHLNTTDKGSTSNEMNSRTSNFDISPVPWKSVQSYSCGVVGLHEEINDFYEKMRPTEQEEEVRLRVVEHITKIIHSLWPLAKVDIFGSFRTGLYLPSSDIDMVIAGEWKNLPLSTLSQALQQSGISESDISIVANATVPIVKLIHTPTKIKVDISFNLTNGLQGVKLIKKLIKQYPALPKLVIVLKQFLLQRGLNEVFNGGLSSYCLTLLVVSMLQGFHKPKTQPSSNLGTLLLEFFELYGINFNYEKVSIHFYNTDKICGMYQPKNRFASPLLSVEDPVKKGHDLGKGTFLIHAVRQAFEFAFLTLQKAVTDSAAEERPLNTYLGLIVQVTDTLWEERRWLSHNYSSIIRMLSQSTSEIREAETETVFQSGYRKKKQYR